MSDERDFLKQNKDGETKKEDWSENNSHLDKEFSWDDFALNQFEVSSTKNSTDDEFEKILAKYETDYPFPGETASENKVNIKPEKQVKPEKPNDNKKDVDVGTDGFEIDFDFDKEYGNKQENLLKQEDQRPIRRNREKKTGCLGGIMYFAFVLAVSVVLACLMWMAATDALALGKEDEQVEVTIPENFTMEEVVDILYSRDLIKYKSLFSLFADFSSAEEKISDGTYVLNKNFDYRALVNGMTESGGVMVETEVTIPEGYTVSQIVKLLSENNVCQEDKLYDTIANYDFDYDFLDDSTLGEKTRLEGFLFPDTYTFYVNDEPERVLDKMLSNFNDKFDKECRARAEEMGYSIKDVITVASMIEKEAGSNEERSLIASVIYNRLDSEDFTTLQIDATIYYAIEIAGENVEFSVDYDNPYNTYLYEGLPPGPISNPGMISINAALYPEETDYYYYALRTDGVHEFFSYQESFNEFVNSEEYGG